MVNLIDDLKQRARRLHRRATAGDPDAIARLRALPELSELDDAQVASSARRRHALSALARALGFDGWPHAKAVLSGDAVRDRGVLMFREHGGAYWNIWSADYDEAARIRREHGGYLLPYKHQFMVVEAPFVASLGLDPDDPDWDAIGRDWLAPADRAAWSRLTHAAIEARLDR